MSKKNKKIKKQDEEDITIGYNTKRKKDKPPKKKRKEKSKWRKLKKVIFGILKLIIIIGVLVGIGAFLFVSPVFNITEIQVENASKISANTYISLSEIKLGENIFRISKSKVRSAITKESYVEEVEIKRKLPGTVSIIVTERTPKYVIEKNGGIYMYIDKNGYYLEDSMETLDFPIIRGTLTDIYKLNPGDRILQEDLEKFNDLIKITDGIKNHNIEQKLSTIDISDDNNYKIEFTSEKKKIMLGDTSNLSTKMEWIRYFMEETKTQAGTIYLNTENVYFAPDK